MVLQVAMSVTLLTCAGLLTHSLEKLQHQDFGFDTQNRLMVKLNPAAAGYSAERLPDLYRKMEEKLSNVPGILTASFSMYSPMEGTYWDTPIFIEGRPVNQDKKELVAWDRVGPHYFETLGTRLLQGRAIDEHDIPTSRAVAVINRAFAEKYFPRENPIGFHFGMADPKDAGTMEIVGVVENAKYYNAREAIAPMFFRPLLQMDAMNDQATEVRSTFVYDIEIRSAARSASLEPLIREAIREVDPNMAVLGVVPFDEQLATYFNRESMVVDLSALFGFLALAIASIGLYAVMSYIVVQRTSEIGVRMALGATRYSVLRLVLKNVFTQAALGMVLGLLCAAAMGRMLSSQLYGITMFDPTSLLAVAICLAVTALAAGLVPAARAASVEPSQALRTE